MQSVAGYSNTGDILEPNAVVTVGGVAYTMDDIKSVRVTRELASNLPKAVTSASGWTAATGDVDWLVGKDVTTRIAHPWTGEAFPPAPATPVTVDLGYGQTLVRKLTGVIEKSSGGTGGRIVRTALLDHTAKLDQAVSFPPHMSVMPPWEENGDFLLCNNSPIYTTDRILRACGFNATPPMDSGCILSVPLMGSSWPEQGRLVSSSQQGFPTFPPSFSESQWGLACNSIEARYEVDSSSWPTSRLDKNLQITLVARRVTSNEGEFTVRVWWGATRVSLAVTADRRIVAVLYDGTTATQVCQLTTATAWTADVFTLRVNPGGGFTLYADNGATATGTVALPAAMTTSNISHVQVTSPHLTGVHCGGLQVGFSTAPTWSRPRTAVLTPSASNLGLQAVPGIKNRIAKRLLEEQAEAECASWWIGEDGVFRWVNRDLLTGAAPGVTLTALDDIMELGWDSDAQGVRAMTVLHSLQPRITRMPVSSVTLYQGSGESLQSGESTTDIIEPDSDESWFNIALYDWNHNQLNRGERSLLGGTIVKDDTPDSWALGSSKLSITADFIDSETLAVTHTAGVLGAGETLVLKTADNDVNLKAFRKDRPLPIIRGKARVRWSELETVGVGRGPADAARLEHEVGFWVQDPQALQVLADWLSGQVLSPRAVLSTLRIRPNHLLQLGDVAWVVDPDNLRIRLKVLITMIEDSIQKARAEMTISGTILAVEEVVVTNEQFDRFHAGRTNSQLDTLWASGTNAQLDADPLGRG